MTTTSPTTVYTGSTQTATVATTDGFVPAASALSQANTKRSWKRDLEAAGVKHYPVKVLCTKTIYETVTKTKIGKF